MLRSVLRRVRSAAFVLPWALLPPSACSDGSNSASSSSSGGASSGAPGSSGNPGSSGSPATPGGGGTPGSVVTPDTTAPTVLSSDPANGAMSAPSAGAISVTFSEGMAAFPAMTFTLRQGMTTVGGTVTQFDDALSFLPTAPLALNTTYTATVTTGALDLAGNPLAAPYMFTFKTSPTAAIGPAPVLLGAAGNYVVVAKSAITNVPTSAITGSLALSPAAASYITGFSMTRAGTKWTSAQVIGGLFAADNDPPTPSNLTTAVSNMEAAYTDAAGRPTPQYSNLAGGAIGGLTLTPGLYKWGSTVTIPADITLSGAANDTWIFQISGDLILSSGKRMTLTNGARAKNIVWQVAGFVALGTTSQAEGIVLSQTAIQLGTGASVHGRLLAQTAVNIAGSTVTAP